jgi:translin
LSTNWESIVESLRQQLDIKHQAREHGLQTCRKVIQSCGKGIRHIHRHQTKEARELIDEARRLVQEARDYLKPHPDLYYAGYLQDAEKEYVEAEALYAIIEKSTMPDPAGLNVHVTAYLNGMAEAASECRRYILDAMRKGETKVAEDCLIAMEDIYDELITFDYPDAITGGLRRTCDALRAVLERTRSDFAISTTQRELQSALERTLEKIEEKEG